MAVSTEFWRGRRALVTGHTGFKGGWLMLWLHSMGAKLCGYSLAASTQPALWHVAKLEQISTSVVADIRDIEKLTRTMCEFQPEVVLHLAAQPLVRASYGDPVDTYSTNVMGTLHVLEAAKATASVKSVVVVTTDKCYENQEWFWPYREEDALGGHDPYSSSKACVEILCASYRASFCAPENFALATARAGNVIGGGDWSADRLVPDVLAAWQNGQQVILRAPEAVRPWQHVLEPLQGYLVLAQKLFEKSDEAARAWNFGPDTSANVTVGKLVEKMAELWQGKAAWCVEPPAADLHEAGLLALDSSRAHNLLDWQPRWSLDQALHNTLKWHHAWCAGQDMQAFTLQQIEDYQRIYE